MGEEADAGGLARGADSDSGSAEAAEPAGGDEAAPAANGSLPGQQSAPTTVSEAKRRLDRAVVKLGEMAVAARKAGDVALIECVRDKQARAGDVTELFDDELALHRDEQATESERSFALEKVGEATLRMEGLLDEARACAGDLGPEDDVDLTRNKDERPNLLPMIDPSAGLGGLAVPSALPADWLPAASPAE